MWALNARKTEAAKYLLAHGADANTRLKDGTTAVMMAARSPDNKELVAALTKAGADVTGEGNYGQTAISEIAAHGTVATVMDLMARGVRIDPKGKSGKRALWDAVVGGNTELVKFFVAEGVDVNMVTPRSSSLLVEAVEYGGPDVLKALLDAGANPDNRGDGDTTPLIAASLSLSINK